MPRINLLLAYTLILDRLADGRTFGQLLTLESIVLSFS